MVGAASGMKEYRILLCVSTVGTFICMYMPCITYVYLQADQCFKQSLSLDSSHVPSLLAYGMCCALDERFDEGETFLEMATTKKPNSAVTWTVCG